LKLRNAANSGFEDLADFVHEVGQRRVIAGLLDGRARSPDFPELFEIRLDWVHRTFEL
jgi:hypothetical protein